MRIRSGSCGHFSPLVCSAPIADIGFTRQRDSGNLYHQARRTTLCPPHLLLYCDHSCRRYGVGSPYEQPRHVRSTVLRWSALCSRAGDISWCQFRESLSNTRAQCRPSFSELLCLRRYLFYTFGVLRSSPYPLFYLRYSLFAVLYPTGIAGEVMTMLAGLPDLKVGVPAFHCMQSRSVVLPCCMFLPGWE